MSTITSLKLWKDVGYTEGSAETPKLNAVLPTADFIFETGATEYKLVPSKDRLFSQFKVTMDYSDAIQCKYLQITLEMNNGDDLTFYGWIDGVSLMSDTDNYSMCQIDWHIDMWRTYMNSVTFGRGLVLRRKEASFSMGVVTDPPQDPACVLRHVDSSKTPINLFGTWVSNRGGGSEDVKVWFLIFTYSEENDDNVEVSTKIAFFPICTDVLHGFHLSNDTSKSTPGLIYVLDGTWDEKLQLTPSRIKGCWISPVPPVNCGQVSSLGYSYWTLSASVTSWEKVDIGPYQYYKTKTITGLDYNYTTYYMRGFSSIMSTDNNHYIIQGFDGETLMECPFGMQINSVDYYLTIGATTAAINVRMSNAMISPGTDGPDDARSNGIGLSVPLINLEVTANSWSEYNYTGAAEYYRSSLAEQTRFVKQVQGVDAATNVAIGGVMTAAGGYAGGAAGAAKSSGGLIGGVSSLLNLGVHNYLQLEDTHNTNLADITANYQSKQPDGLLLAGNDLSVITRCVGPRIVPMIMDSYSQDRFDAQKLQYGVKVSEPTASCQSLVNAGGPLQIDNLNITGNVPIEAIQYMKSRLKRGVLLT